MLSQREIRDVHQQRVCQGCPYCDEKLRRQWLPCCQYNWDLGTDRRTGICTTNPNCEQDKVS